MSRLIRRALRAMRDHDANPELNNLYERGRFIVGWQWSWFEWSFGVVVYLDPKDNPGAWLNLGPLAAGCYVDTGRQW